MGKTTINPANRKTISMTEKNMAERILRDAIVRIKQENAQQVKVRYTLLDKGARIENAGIKIIIEYKQPRID